MTLPNNKQSRFHYHYLKRPKGCNTDFSSTNLQLVQKIKYIENKTSALWALNTVHCAERDPNGTRIETFT